MAPQGRDSARKKSCRPTRQFPDLESAHHRRAARARRGPGARFFEARGYSPHTLRAFGSTHARPSLRPNLECCFLAAKIRRTPFSSHRLKQNRPLCDAPPGASHNAWFCSVARARAAQPFAHSGDTAAVRLNDSSIVRLGFRQQLSAGPVGPSPRSARNRTCFASPISGLRRRPTSVPSTPACGRPEDGHVRDRRTAAVPHASGRLRPTAALPHLNP